MTTERLSVWFQDEAKFCGCGNPREAASALLDLLDCHPLYEHSERFAALLPPGGFLWILLYWLDSLGLTEHGGGVLGAWLTDGGKEVRDALRAERDRDNFETLFVSRCIHGYPLDDAEHDCLAAD